MSHFNVIVLITPKNQEKNHLDLWKQKYSLPNGKTGRSATDAVSKMLAPYSFFSEDDWPAGVLHCMGWDYYEIGGRWAGQFLPGYDPEQDPLNQVQCTFCNGDGISKQATSIPDATEVCHACQGKGHRAKWPSDWRIVEDGDIIPIMDIPDDLYADAIITPDGVWHECGEWFGELLHEPGFDEWKAKIKSLLEQHRDAVAVNVDIHN